MARKLYPIGIQTFEEIRKNDFLYIDKTEYIYRMTHTSGKYFFLSRPRRFGKSLLVSTFQSYFEGKKELFEGLAIEKLEKEWNSYPVLHFDLSKGKHMEKEQLEEYLGYLLEDYEKKYGIANHRNGNNNRLTDLIEFVFNKTGKQVVVLIDEYDAPLLDVAHEDDRLDDLRNVMRNFYSPLKGCEAMLRFVFMTGITKFSQLSIFSELNNITNVSMKLPFAGVCGIIKEELLLQMSEDIDELANNLNLSREKTIQELKDHYDGYHFCWPSPDVFNPYSLLNCFADGEMDSYWFASGTPTYLILKMREFNVKPSQLGRVRATKSSFDVATERMTSLTPLLYQSGYLTIKDYDEDIDVYTLDFPNKEIEVGLFDSLLPGYLGPGIDEGRVVIADISVLLKNKKVDEAMQLLADFLETETYCDNTNYEGHYQQLLYMIFALLTGYDIHVEPHTAKGRIDLSLETKDIVYVIELKLNKSAQEAMDQINAKHYADAFKMKGKEIVKVGINFALENEVNTLTWVVE